MQPNARTDTRANKEKRGRINQHYENKNKHRNRNGSCCHERLTSMYNIIRLNSFKSNSLFPFQFVPSSFYFLYCFSQCDYQFQSIVKCFGELENLNYSQTKQNEKNEIERNQ